jgi:hypothetical protein
MEQRRPDFEDNSIFPERSLVEHSVIVSSCVAMGAVSAVTQIGETTEAMLNAATVQSFYSIASAYIFFEAMQKYLSARSDEIGSKSSEALAMFGPALATTLLNFTLHSFTTFGGDKEPVLATAGTFVLASIWSPIWYVRHKIDQIGLDFQNLEIDIVEEDMKICC